jgi:hypothetical protein
MIRLSSGRGKWAEIRILAREDLAGPLIDHRRCPVEERVLTSFMGDF